MSEKYRLLFYLKSNKSWQYFISLLLDVLLLEKKTTKISSQRKSQSIRAAKICSRKPQKITNPQNKSPAKILCYALYSSDKRPRATGFRHNFDHLSILWDKRDNCFITSFPRSPFQPRKRDWMLRWFMGVYAENDGSSSAVCFVFSFSTSFFFHLRSRFVPVRFSGMIVLRFLLSDHCFNYTEYFKLKITLPPGLHPYCLFLKKAFPVPSLFWRTMFLNSCLWHCSVLY